MVLCRYGEPDKSIITKDHEIVELLDDINSTLKKPKYFVEEYEFDLPYYAHIFWFFLRSILVPKKRYQLLIECGHEYQVFNSPNGTYMKRSDVIMFLYGYLAKLHDIKLETTEGK